MSEEEKQKEKKNTTLTMQSSKLKLSSPVDGSKLQKSISHGQSSKNVTVVQVKKRRFQRGNESKIETGSGSEVGLEDIDAGSLTSSEQNVRLKALKLAKKNKKEQEEQELVTSVEEGAVKEERAEEEVSTTPAIVEEIPDVSKSKHGQKHENFDKSKETEKGKKKTLNADVKGVGKSRFERTRRNSGKINVNTVLESEEEERERGRSLAAIKRAREKAKRANLESLSEGERIKREVILPEIITVQELAARMSERNTDVVKELMKLGIIATANQTIDADTAELVIGTFGHKMKRISEADVEKIIEVKDDNPDLLEARAPVVTVMGHVDHGKTSLLDALRSTDVVEGEAGGITQHIGAYRVKLESGDYITFLDTPGHEAFTAMRSRGAKSTDIVVLVVAADDGIKAQTIEAINHAKAAEVPIIVAVNKIDKPGADPQKLRNELLAHSLIPEEMGGDIIVVDVSAKEKLNLDKLEESILLQAEMMDLKANPIAPASGVVVESRIDKKRGVIATVLVQRGTMRVGDIVVAGASFGRVRLMSNDKGKTITEATPSMPVEVLGLDEVPAAGDNFSVVDTERQARDISEYRIRREKNLKAASVKKGSLEELFNEAIANGKTKELPIIIKADVQGSVEAISGSLLKLPNDEVKLKILHTGAGGITESDVGLAGASNAIILGFNVRANNNAKALASEEGVDIRYFSIIYNLVDDIKSILSGMLSPIIREEYIGSAEIRKVYNISKVGKIAGCYVTSGVLSRGAGVRLLRDDVVIHEGKLKTLKRFKEDVKEVKENFECGIAFERYDDLKEGDKLEVFEIAEEQQTL